MCLHVTFSLPPSLFLLPSPFLLFISYSLTLSLPSSIPHPAFPLSLSFLPSFPHSLTLSLLPFLPFLPPSSSLSLLQFPLPEVVVIHRDPTCHEQLKQLESYVLEELNVKKLTLAAEDSKYGVHLQGEPDNERLGKRLKGDFKKVAPAIKALKSEQLTALQQSGKITVEGHVLSVDDIKVSPL